MFAVYSGHITHLPPRRSYVYLPPPLLVPGLVPPPGALARPRAPPPRPVPWTVHHEPDTFHCKYRDAFLTGGPPALAALFERCVVLDDVREARRGIEAGVLERVRIATF